MSSNQWPAQAERWLGLARWLLGATIAFDCLEAAVALWSGVAAGSIALVSFGLDSFIEISAAALMLWRLLPGAIAVDERSERTVRRFVGATFFLLALYVTVESSRVLLTQQRPSESWAGIAIAAVALVIMPALAWGKLRAATVIGSAALRSEAKESLACAYLSLVVLLGLLANAIAGWWWADPAAALLMVPWLSKEGLEGVRGGEDDD